jgi:DNA-binding transcriptional LysR family regulator
MRIPSLLAVRAFESAARLGSFKAAAEDLNLSPSAVSHAIRKLEAELSLPLFKRSGRTVQLNPAGETLLRHVSRGLEEIAHGMTTVAGRKSNLLRLHCAPSMATQWLMPRLRRLTEETGLDVRLSAGTDYSRFINDEFDVDIVYGPAPSEGLMVVPLGEETVSPLCTPALARQIETAADLRELPLIESESKRVRWSAWFAQNDLSAPLPTGSRFDRSFMAIAAAADGMGVALESTRLAEREIARGDLVQPLLNKATDIRYVGHFLTFLPRVRQNPTLRTFLSWLADELTLPLDLGR